MTTDDVHDLFGRDRGDEPDDPAKDEGADASDGTDEWDELLSLDADGDATEPSHDEVEEHTRTPLSANDPAETDERESRRVRTSGDTDEDGDDGVDAPESSTASDRPAESGADDPGLDWSTSPTDEGSGEDDGSGAPDGRSTGEADPSGASDESGDSDGDALELAASADESAEGDEPGSARSTAVGRRADANDLDATERAGSSTSTDATDDDAGGRPSAESASSGRTGRDERRTSGPAGSPTTASGRSDAGGPGGHEAAGTTSEGGAVGDDGGEPVQPEPSTRTRDDSVEGVPRESASISPEESDAERNDGSGADRSAAHAAASTGAETSDSDGRSGSVAETGSTDGPVPHDEAESTASPEEPATNPAPSKAAGGGASGSTASGTVDEGSATGSSAGSNRLPTGIDELDRAMGGGVPPGRLVVLVADPGVQSELIVDSVLAQRDTLYVTTDRPEWEVEKDIEPGLGTGDVEIRDQNPDSLLSGLDTLLDDLGTSSNFVLDSVNELELVPRQRYRIFLSDVKRRLFDTGSVGLLTGVTVGHESARDLTLRRADVVWRLETRTTEHEIENRLTVPKFRGGAAVTETIKLELTDEVKVDTSHSGW